MRGTLSAQHLSPCGKVGREAHAKEAERAFGDDRSRQTQRGRTMMGEITLGSKCRVMILYGVVPMERAARMNSRSFRARIHRARSVRFASKR